MISKQQILDARILIVDDNKANVLLMEKMLKSAGYANLRSVTDSRRATGIYQDFHPDLVLLDIRMPNVDGYQVMERLREIEHNSYIPVLILTAYQEYETRLRALKLGAKDFLTKPIDRVEALTRINNLLEVRLLHNQTQDQNTTLEKRVRERTKELEETQLEIIHRLGRAAEYRDNETGLHTIRMSKISALIGKAAGMSEDKCELLLHASPMHDIGKIGIPDGILLKPGKLDANEWKIMKTHATIGGKLLCGHKSDLMKMACVIALTHHEKWDGTGYPKGLKGEKIPLVGRVCCLGDAFDAMVSNRVYREKISIKESIEEIERCSGKHFDPELVEAFKKISPEIEAIKDEYAEPNGNGQLH